MERFFVKIKNNVYFKIDNLLAVIAEFLSHSYGFDVFYSWRFDGKVCHYSFFNEENDLVFSSSFTSSDELARLDDFLDNKIIGIPNLYYFISCLEKFNDTNASYSFIVKSILSPSEIALSDLSVDGKIYFKDFFRYLEILLRKCNISASYNEIEEDDDITWDYGNVRRICERYYDVLTISADGETIVSYKKISRIITRVKGMIQDAYYGMTLSDQEILTIVGDLTKKYPEFKKLEDALLNNKDVRIKDLTFGTKLIKE